MLWNGPSNSYDVHLSQHFFALHVTFGVTQWKPGVPNPNTSKENWFATGKTIKQVQKYKIFWYLPNDDTCSKMSSNSYERFSLSDFTLSAIPPEKEKKDFETKRFVRGLLQNKLLRSFPSIALRIPTVHNFTRDQRERNNGGFFFTAGPRHRGKSSFSWKRVRWSIKFIELFRI